jgi:hypothetical protein
MRRTFVVCLLLAACGGSSVSPSSTPVVALATPSPTPSPTPGCEAWPAEMADMLARLPLPTGLCLRYEAGPGQSSYGNRVISIRQDNNPFGNLARMAHELGHAHQDWLAATIGTSLRNFTQTAEGQAYLVAGGWSSVPGCENNGIPACWTQDISFCERNFCQVPILAGGNYGTPVEENADFVGNWYNPAKVAGWGRDAFLSQPLVGRRGRGCGFRSSPPVATSDKRCLGASSRMRRGLREAPTGRAARVAHEKRGRAIAYHPSG